jgi:hypothetical protein
METPRSNPMITHFQDAVGEQRIRVDAPGERAVSAVITDPIDLIHRIADQCGLEVDDSLDGQITISIPPGA